MISFEGVGKRYDNGFQAMQDVSFDVDNGEMVFITGHSGAGKSTMLRLIMLIERASQGRIVVNDQDFDHLRGSQIANLRRQIGMVFQDHNLLRDRTVADNVALPLIIAGLPHAEIQQRVHASLDWMGLGNKADSLPVTLSGGEQQRVGIARAIVNKPRLLLADEPTGNLDPELAHEIMDLFDTLSQAGMTVLVATHDLPLVARYRHRLLSLRQGHLTGDAS